MRTISLAHPSVEHSEPQSLANGQEFKKCVDLFQNKIEVCIQETRLKHVFFGNKRKTKNKGLTVCGEQVSRVA